MVARAREARQGKAGRSGSHSTWFGHPFRSVYAAKEIGAGAGAGAGAGDAGDATGLGATAVPGVGAMTIASGCAITSGPTSSVQTLNRSSFAGPKEVVRATSVASR